MLSNFSFLHKKLAICLGDWVFLFFFESFNLLSKISKFSKVILASSVICSSVFIKDRPKKPMTDVWVDWSRSSGGDEVWQDSTILVFFSLQKLQSSRIVDIALDFNIGFFTSTEDHPITYECIGQLTANQRNVDLTLIIHASWSYDLIRNVVDFKYFNILKIPCILKEAPNCSNFEKLQADSSALSVPVHVLNV